MLPPTLSHHRSPGRLRFDPDQDEQDSYPARRRGEGELSPRASNDDGESIVTVSADESEFGVDWSAEMDPLSASEREGGDNGGGFSSSDDSGSGSNSSDGSRSSSSSSDDSTVTTASERRRIRDRERQRRIIENESEAERLQRLRRRREQIRERNARQALAQVQAQRVIVNVADFQNEAFIYDHSLAYADIACIRIGGPTIICQFCGAHRYAQETSGICCSNGKVDLEPIQPFPEPYASLFDGQSEGSQHLLKNIRRYNSCFQMTSFGVTGETNENLWSTFRIQGQIYHRIGSLLPLPDESPRFMQVYFMGDAADQVDLRYSLYRDTRRSLVQVFQRHFDAHNELIRVFRTALERMPSDEHAVMIRGDLRPRGEHARRFNAPTANDVAIVLIDGGGTNARDIVIQRRPGGRGPQLKRIYETHPSYDALQYPMIFWQGNFTYDLGMRQVDPVTRLPTTKKLTMMNYYSHQLMIRSDQHNHALKCRALLNQFVVDMYAKIEAERLRYLRMNQTSLRVDDYIHLHDAIRNDGNAENVGQLVILPSTFTGSPRHMHGYAQDAMAIVAKSGRPDLFITFTCNPNWPEIRDHLFEGQSAPDRHDLCARVFHLKHLKLIELIVRGKIFGPTSAHMYTIEWQKRGLPHSHSLIWLSDRLRPEQIDQIISAELPDPDQDPVLFQTISRNMIHNICGQQNPHARCMERRPNGEIVCGSNYPRPFLEHTVTGQDGYPLYRRRSPEQGGHTIQRRVDGVVAEIIDNRRVVPHSPILCKIFNSHLNVEYCNSVKSIKYICKYINKGCDMASIEHSGDEITQYQLGRYISTNEAFWRIFSFPVHDRHPAIQHLTVHLENGQRVYFNENNAARIAANPANTTLTAFFALCQADEFARTLLYAEVPTYYTWHQPSKTFRRRRQGNPVLGYDIRSTDMIGRVYVVHPKHKECFYLRLLLHNVTGPTSFQYLKTVDGHVCRTFQEACLRRGLLENDSQWIDTMQQAANTQLAPQLRSLFAILLTQCEISNPHSIWDRFKDALSEDIRRNRYRILDEFDDDAREQIHNEALIRIEDLCLRLDGKLLNQLNMPSPNRMAVDPLNREILRESSYNTAEMAQYVERHLPTLVQDQRAAYDTITNAIRAESGRFFFLDAPGGTGKTFLINLILARVRQARRIIMAVASSGIAATLLSGGRTAHSAFKLPLRFDSTEPTCNVPRGSALAMLLTRCSAIIWDECTMADRRLLEALNRTLKFLRGNDNLFGGVTVIMAGDFRQILPVISRGTPADALNACLKNSLLWRHVETLSLRTNMRVHLRREEGADLFAGFLLEVGDGRYPRAPDSISPFTIELPQPFCHLVADEEELISSVYPHIEHNYTNSDWLSQRAILATTNAIIHTLNQTIQEKIPGRTRHYFSIDRVVDSNNNPDNDNNINVLLYPSEFLNTLDPAGFPPHHLMLKVGSPIMVLRNLNPPHLVNGTRLVIRSLQNNLIEAVIMMGQFRGQIVLIPRIPLIAEDLIVRFKRLQFPVRLCFAMTINKSQGQSLGQVGLHLRESCFSHGQLYVACSRVGSPSGLHIFAPARRTENIVYRQALR